MKPRGARLRAAVGALDSDQRFAAIAAAALLVTMFLPWYEKSVVIPGRDGFAHDSISAFGAVSFVEAAIFLVSAGVLALVLTRAEGGRYHLPGGDGTVILAAGLWAGALIFYRVFDRPNVSGEGGTVGIQWGFFVAFVAAGAVAFAGQRMRVANRPSPPVRKPRPGRMPAPGHDDDDPFADDADDVTRVVAVAERRAEAPPRSQQSAQADLPGEGRTDVAASERRTEVRPGSERRTEVIPASERGTEVGPGSERGTEVGPGSEGRTEVTPASERRTEVGPGSEGRTEVIPASERRTEVGPAQPGQPPDRAVRREDAEQLTFEGPAVQEPPLRRRSRRSRTD